MLSSPAIKRLSSLQSTLDLVASLFGVIRRVRVWKVKELDEEDAERVDIVRLRIIQDILPVNHPQEKLLTFAFSGLE